MKTWTTVVVLDMQRKHDLGIILKQNQMHLLRD